MGNRGRKKKKKAKKQVSNICHPTFCYQMLTNKDETSQQVLPF